jgi:predicted nucleic acid-binding protein
VSFVLDASIAGAWFLPEPSHPAAAEAWQRIRVDGAAVPAIWWYEIRNLLLMAERRKRLGVADVDLVWDRLGRLRVQIDNEPDDHDGLTLARRHGLSFYDAAYLELAMRQHLPLATSDQALTRAAMAEKVPLIGAQP